MSIVLTSIDEIRNHCGVTISVERRVACEALGTAFLLAGIIGSGIMAQRICGGNAGVALLANSIATAGVLFALVAALGPYSGAHLNPAVTLCAILRGELSARAGIWYAVAQIAGASIGAAAANAMFGLPAIFPSHHERDGIAQAFSESIATFGLILTIVLCSRRAPRLTAFAVPAYIAGAYWFTSSTSFANPAVTLGRTLSDTFAGIRPSDAPAFIIAQITGALAALAFATWVEVRSLKAEEFA